MSNKRIKSDMESTANPSYYRKLRKAQLIRDGEYKINIREPKKRGKNEDKSSK